MKTIFSFVFIFCICIVSVMSQDVDSSLFAPLEVEVTNFENVPQKGESIIFEGVNSDLMYSGTTNSEGKFDLIIKGGETYLIKIKSIGKDTDYSTFEVPKLDKGRTYSTSNLLIQFELPRTFTLDNVHFNSGKAELTKSSYSEINELLEYMKIKEDLVIEIAGHTDNVGEDEYNMDLSERRAKSVKNYLVSNGISPERIIAKGYGESQPIASNEIPEGRQKNRRTEVRILEE